ncbi:SMI1/KNR4 family protein [Actinoplanes sp. NPDC051851]|uniref:SMI1/KNR4 family protein n=1 Tax=Actinoplanes sp. NPDC051851 TaxID=3154753 RepID=UPI003440B36B
MLTVDEIARRVRDLGGGPVRGVDADGLRRLCESWGVERLPRVYLDFLSQLGVSAGELLRGTDGFFPEILSLPEDVEEFFAEDEGGMPRPPGVLVFAMHQGYQVYWMTDVTVPDPEVVLYTERRPEPLMTWPSFTHFLNAEFELSYGSEACSGVIG